MISLKSVESFSGATFGKIFSVINLYLSKDGAMRV
jgi:hypothetical protein